MSKDLQDSELFEQHYGLKERRSNVRFFAAIIALAFFILGFRFYWVNTFGGVQVDGNSMNITLTHGEQLLVEYTPNGKGAKRGDIIVVYVESYPEVQAHNALLPENRKVKYLIKRLIATEGDTVKCEKGQVYIKYSGTSEFEALNEPYAYYKSQKIKESYSFAEYEVGEGEIFFLGDNRMDSLDSRYKEGVSHLSDRLYCVEDIFGVVPMWAVEYQSILEKIFFR